MEEIEQWQDIKGHEGKYQASDQGRVRSITRTIINCRGRKQSFRETILRPDYAPNGYERVCLPKDGKYKHHRVAKIIYETFVGPVPEGMENSMSSGAPLILIWQSQLPKWERRVFWQLQLPKLIPRKI